VRGPRRRARARRASWGRLLGVGVACVYRVTRRSTLPSHRPRRPPAGLA
jgi:hypothetical protein